MALSPLSRAPASIPSSQRASGLSPAATRPQGPAGLQGSRQQGLDLRKLLGADGFDAPLDSKKAGGLEAVAQVLTRVAQVLADSARVLGGEGGTLGKNGPLGQSAPVSKCGPVGAGGSISEGAPVSAGAPVGESAPALELPSKGTPQATEAKAVAPSGAAPKSGNTMTFTNDGTKPMTIQFTPNTGDKAVEPLTLEPGKTQTVSFPEGWSGNFRSTSGDGSAPTLGEVKFNGGFGQTYYDVSYIEGNNAMMTIAPESQGGRVSGTMDNLLDAAPDAIKAKGTDGKAFGIKKSTTSNVQDPAVVDFYRKHVGADEGYVIPTDDASTLGTSDTHLNVHLKDLT